MWTCTEISVIKGDIDGIASVTYKYAHTDGRTAQRTERVSDMSTINRIAMNAINEFARVDAVVDFIANNSTVEYVAPTPPADPTPEELAQQNYIIKRRELIIASQDLGLGLIEQAEYDALKQEVLALKP